MPNYAEIERERVNGNKYVSYNFDKMHPKMPDGFSPEYNWCKYWIDGINGGPSRYDIYSENLNNHDYYNCDPGKLNFRVAENVLRQKLIKPGMSPKDVKNAETIIGYFKSLTTINDKSNQNCKLMIYAGASINWSSLLNDIGAAKTPTDISRVLQSLTAEVNAAALNGAFSKIFHAANKHGKNSSTPDGADKSIEDKIIKLYNKTMNGDKGSPAIEIPKDPSAPFKTPETILKVLEGVKDKTNLSPNEVYKQIVEPCEKTINKIKSTSKSR